MAPDMQKRKECVAGRLCGFHPIQPNPVQLYSNISSLEVNKSTVQVVAGQRPLWKIFFVLTAAMADRKRAGS